MSGECSILAINNHVCSVKGNVACRKGIGKAILRNLKLLINTPL